MAADIIITPTPEPAWLTVKQAAARAQVSVSTILRASRSPDKKKKEPPDNKQPPEKLRPAPLRSVRVGGRKILRYRPAWIDEWLLANTAEAAEQRQLRMVRS